MGWPSAKPEQHQIVEAILNRDVFVILPTGYGKSACYQCLPLLHKKMYPSKAPIICCKDNIMYVVVESDGIEKIFEPLATKLLQKQASYPCTLIYCRSVQMFIPFLRHIYKRIQQEPHCLIFQDLGLWTCI